MLIKFNDINYYYLTCNNEKRELHLLNEFKGLKLFEVNPITEKISKLQSGCSGFIRMIDLAAQHQKNKFEPFALFEDDVKKKNWINEIEIPDDSDILYIGLSKTGLLGNVGTNLQIKHINDKIMKINNMLSTHGMVVTSIRGMLIMQKCMMEDYFRNRPWDLALTEMQPHINVYGLKNPLVFQWRNIGGNELYTYFHVQNNFPEIYPKINNENISIKSNFTEKYNCKNYIIVGMSDKNEKKIKCNLEKGTELHFKYYNYEYKYEYEVTGEELIVKRKDGLKGWNENLILYKKLSKDDLNRPLIKIGSNDTYPSKKNYLLLKVRLPKGSKLEFKPEKTEYSDRFDYEIIDEETIKIRRIDKIEGWGQNLEAYICKLHKEYTKDGKRILPIGSNDTYPTRKNHLIIFTELSKDTKLEFKPENTNHSDKFEYEFLDDNGKLKITRIDKVEGWCQDLEAYIL